MMRENAALGRGSLPFHPDHQLDVLAILALQSLHKVLRAFGLDVVNWDDLILLMVLCFLDDWISLNYMNAHNHIINSADVRARYQNA